MNCLKYSILLAPLILFWGACRKNNKNLKSNTDLLTQKSWILKDARTRNTSGNWENIYPLIDTCRSDNLVSFSISGIYTIDEGPTKCYPIDPQTMLTDTWAFQKNETQVVLHGTEVKTLLLLNEDTLKYLETIPVGWGSTESELTYTH